MSTSALCAFVFTEDKAGWHFSSETEIGRKSLAVERFSRFILIDHTCATKLILENGTVWEVGGLYCSVTAQMRYGFMLFCDGIVLSKPLIIIYRKSRKTLM